MPDVIDSFIMELGIDPAGVEKGRKEAAASMAQLLGASKTSGKQVEAEYKKISDAFESVGRKALGYITLLLGGMTVTSVVKDVVQTDKAVGILSDTTGEAVDTLSKWRYVFERLGGSKDAITNTIVNISKEMGAMAVGGSSDSSSLIAVLNALNYYGVNIRPRKQDGSWKSPTDVLLEIADAIPTLNTSRENLVGILRKLGLDDASISIMMRGGNELRNQLKLQDDIAKTTDTNRKSADALNQSYARLRQAAEQTGRMLVTGLLGPLKAVLDLTADGLKAMNLHTKDMEKSWEQRDYEMRTKLGLPVYTGYRPGGGGGGSGGGGGGGDGAPRGSNEPLPAPSGDTKLDERGAHLTNGGVSVKPWLLDTVREASKYLPPGYTAKIISAVDARSRTPWHPRGDAIDVKIYNDKGTPVANIGNGPQYTLYERMALAAKKIQMEKYPKEKFIWGGHFNSGVPFDLMHFQSGGVSARDFTKEQLAGPLPNVSPFDKAAPIPMHLRGLGGMVSRAAAAEAKRTETRTDISTVNVHTQAADPVGIAADIKKALQSGGVSGSGAN